MRRSAPIPVALVVALLLALVAPTPAEAGGLFRHRRACPPPCPAPCPVPPLACCPPTAAPVPYAAAPSAVPQIGQVKICMVCENESWRPAMSDEFDKCVLQDRELLGTWCPGYVSGLAAGAAAPAPRKSCEPWFRMYCDHANGCNGWRFPRNWQEWQESVCLPISHYGRQCWFPLVATPHQMPSPMPK